MEELKKLLQKGVVKFSYTKTDGSLRIAWGTLYPSALSGLSKTKKFKPAPAGNVTYYDLAVDDWRIYREDYVEGILQKYEHNEDMTLEELKKMYRPLIEGVVLTESKVESTPATTEAEPSSKKSRSKKTILQKLLEKHPKPTVDRDGFFVTDSVWNGIMTNIYNSLNTSHPVNTLMVGPAGTGKTELIRFVCEKMGLPYRHDNIGTRTDVQASLIGTHTIDSEGHSSFQYARFVQDIQEPGVIMLDELNRNPQALNILTNVLDGIRELNVSGTGAADAKVVKVDPKCIFFATANIGATYTGTSMIDEALETRFDYIGVDYIPEEEETKLLVSRTGCSIIDAMNISKIVWEMRRLFSKEELSRSVSTRESLRIAQKCSIGNSLQDAFESLLQRFEGTNSEGERGIVYKIIRSH